MNKTSLHPSLLAKGEGNGELKCLSCVKKEIKIRDSKLRKLISSPFSPFLLYLNYILVNYAPTSIKVKKNI